MCIIIFNNRNDSATRLERSVLVRAQEQNPDGIGIMYSSGGKLITWTTMTDLKGIWARYCNARNAEQPVAIHFRKNTQGESVLDNCHPFSTHDNALAVMHNGTIAKGDLGSIPKDYSDTRYFAESIINRLPGDFLADGPMFNMVRKMLTGDRMLFMDRRGGHSIMNERTGKWVLPADEVKDSKNAVWFSHTRDNGYFLTGKKVVHTPMNHGNWMSRSEQTNIPWMGKARAMAKDVLRVPHSDIPKSSVKGAKPTVNDPLGRGHSGISGNFASKQRRLLFVYGNLRDDVDSGLKIPVEDAMYYGIGIAEGIQLWAINDVNCPKGVRPGALKMQNKSEHATHGYVMCLTGGDTEKILEKLDAQMGAKTVVDGIGLRYYRTTVQVAVGSSDSHKRGTFTAYTYLATPIESINPIEAPVPLGDWSEWLNRDIEVESVGSEIVMSANVVEKDGSDGILCHLCNGDDCVGYDIKSTDLDPQDDRINRDGLLPSYWCQTCFEEFPVEMTAVEIDERAQLTASLELN